MYIHINIGVSTQQNKNIHDILTITPMYIHTYTHTRIHAYRARVAEIQQLTEARLSLQNARAAFAAMSQARTLHHGHMRKRTTIEKRGDNRIRRRIIASWHAYAERMRVIMVKIGNVLVYSSQNCKLFLSCEGTVSWFCVVNVWMMCFFLNGLFGINCLYEHACMCVYMYIYI